MRLFNRAYEYVVSEVAKGGYILFVGTKRQARESIKEEAERCGMFYINHRWLGGTLTNFQTIKKGIERLKSIESMQADGSISRFPKKEVLLMGKEQIKLNRNIGGVKHMRGLPSALFVVDPKKEQIAVSEAVKLGIPVIGLVDTNCDPDGIDFVIPGNDDAIRAVKLITSKIADAVLAGREQVAEDGGAGEEMAAAMAAAEGATVMEAPDGADELAAADA